MKTEGDETGECSSSEAFIEKSLCDNLSENDIRNFVIRRLGLHRGASCTVSSVSRVPGSNSECCCMRPCKVCNQPKITLEMLICDQCEEAYHISCSYPRRRKLPLNEWFCPSCLKKKHKLPELTAKGSLSYQSEVGKGRTAISRGALGLGPIAAMLEDAEPYTTSVRIGKEFQAEVPNWSGPLANEDDYFNEMLERRSLTDSFQKVDTDRVLKDSKYLEMLKPRLAARKRKLGYSKNVVFG